MNLKERYCGNAVWENATTGDLLLARMAELDTAGDRINELARILAHTLDSLPLTDAQKVDITGSFRWELSE